MHYYTTILCGSLVKQLQKRLLNILPISVLYCLVVASTKEKYNT